MDTFNRKTDEIYVSVETPPPEQDQPTNETIRFIDVHVYDLPAGEEPPTIESEPDQETPIVDDQGDTEPVQPQRHTRNIFLWLVGITCLLIASALVMALLFPLLTAPTVTITIVPITRQIDTTQTLLVSTTTTGTQGTVPGRSLSALTMSQQKTVPTTGQGHQNATLAHGYITLYNSATYAQDIPAGTLLTGSDGVQVVTDQDVTIPAVSYPTLGHVTISAHAVITGPGGNIQGGDIYGPCCRLNISAVNSAFIGGQNARVFSRVTHSDIDAVTNDLKASLIQSAQAAFQQQVQSDETLLPLSCTLTSTPDHAAGTEATHVTVTVSETCTGMVYNTQAMQLQVTQIATQEATKQLGNGYSLTGTVNDTITQVTPRNGSVAAALQIRITANYSYQFTDQQQQLLINSIAGKSRNAAMDTVLHTPGVQSASISGPTLPTDTQHIRVLVVYAG